MAQRSGTTKDFRAWDVTRHPDDVWRLWVSPDTWGTWDRGLRSGQLDGPFADGVTGTIVGLDGRRSRFVVDRVEEGRGVEWHVPLPGAAMRLSRTLQPQPEGAWRVEHRVHFTGALATVWAALLGRRFRPMLAPTVDALIAAAHGDRG
jgi:hypothetical protein